MARKEIEGNAKLSNLIEGLKGFSRILMIVGFGLIFVCTANAQVGNGSSSPENKNTSNKADQNLKSIARVNPSTLAMEMSVPLMSYPGRNGNNLPVGFSYSSKIWRMESRFSWWYRPNILTNPKYVTDINAIYGERTAAGWTSNLLPPRIDEKFEIYDESGHPWSENILDQPGLNASWLNILSGFGQNNAPTCGLRCAEYDPSRGCDTITGECWCIHYEVEYCNTNGPTFPTPPPPIQLYYVKRLQISMSDGSTHEFRESDTPINCGTNQTGCAPNLDGTYLSVDGSGMKLVRDGNNRTLFMPDGSRYKFPSLSQVPSEGIYADEFIDSDGNKLAFTGSPANNPSNKWTDTLGREIVDPIPHNVFTQMQSSGTKEIELPGLGGEKQEYKLKWENLKPLGCETKTVSECIQAYGQTYGTSGGALEDQNQNLYHETRYFCRGNQTDDLLEDPSDPYNETSQGPENQVLFPEKEIGIRPCNSFNILRDSEGEPILENGLAQPFATRFNPVVLSEVELPNGKKYIFKYNRYGEISKIVYPTGSYETFTYSKILPMSGAGNPAYDQTNRGVTERRVYSANGTLQQRWRYSAEFNYASGGNSTYKITTTAPKGDDPLGDGIMTERFLYNDASGGGDFGFNNPLAGMPKEEKTYDELGNPRSRTLTEYVTKNNGNVRRDARVKRTVAVAIENGLALAKLSETEYNETETPGNNAQTDAEYFSHLDVKRTKGYHYAVIDLNTAQNGTLAQIAAYFNSSLLASVSETDYDYNPNYKQRGIRSRAVESRVLNPSNTTEIVARTQTVYDEPSRLVADSGNLSGNLANTWVDPNTTLRGKPTTAKVWDSDNNIWIETHTQYDQYGNVRKIWEASTAATYDATRFVETQYSAEYGFAYPTRVIVPAPDPSGTHGTSQPSEATTTYDFITGLALSVTNEFGQITRTEYNDALLRPTRVYAFNFTAPETQTIYDDTALTVKVRKQIDETNWDEATTFSDSLGRTVKTQAKDSQGDVIAETKYDFLSRVKWTSNPYRAGETVKYWSRPRYDLMSRVFESCAPVIDDSEYPLDFNSNLPCPSGTSLGITEYGISTAENFIGAYVLTTDAAGKQSRAINNALGQLTRVDEPDYTGAISALPQSTPNPSPTPTPSTPPNLPPPGCLDQCLTNTEYPSYATIYRYNEQGKMVSVIQGEQKRFFLYDSLGRLIRIRQPEQEINPALTTQKGVDGNTQWSAAFTYDLKGNVLTATDANGTVITNTYDKANRITTKTYSNEPNGQTTPAVEYLYDGFMELSQPPSQSPNYAKGKLTKVKSSVSETRYTNFDYLGRLLQMQQITNGQTYTSGYQYNFSGALVQETYPSGRVVKNEYEADGDLSRIYGNANTNAIERTYANGFSYTPDGKIQRLKLGNNRWESAKFNNRLQVTELALGTSDGDGSLWELQYEYAQQTANGTVNTGNITKQTLSFNGLANPLVQTFKYDSLDRLTEARETTNNNQTWKETFSYDRYGNRTGHEKFTGTTQLVLDHQTHPTINPATNRFNTGQGYNYDKNGNLIKDAENRSFVFNGENKQKYVVQNNQTIGEYFYDGEGKRVKKVVYNPDGISIKEETVFVYSAGKLVAEYSIAAPPQNPTTKWTVTDQLLSPRVITDSLGNVLSRRDFMPFGEEIVNNLSLNDRPDNLKYGTTDGIRQKFTGYQKDEETGLDFAEARMYENRHGRFTAVDPLLSSGKSATPQTFNRYVYCLSNPLRFTDPNGLQTVSNPNDEPEIDNTPIIIRTIWDSLLGKYADQVNNYLSWTTDPDPDIQMQEGWGPTGPTLKFVSPTKTTGRINFEFNRTMEKVDEGVQIIPVFGSTYNFLKAGSELDRGQGSYGNLAFQGAMLALDFIPGSQGGKQGGKIVLREEIKSGITVLGNNPTYKTLARQLGATYLNVPERIMRKFSNAEEFWKTINVKFLDAAIKRGDVFVLATPFNKIKPGSFFEREVDYLMKRGYVLIEDGTKLIRGTQ